MVTKVGSAGYVVDSVIQYQQAGGSRPEISAETEKPAQKTNAGNTKVSPSVNSQIHKSSAPTARAKQSDAVGQYSTDAEKTGGNVIEEERFDFGLSQEAIKITVDEVNKKLEPLMSEVEVSYHEKTGRYSFKVLDKKTGEIIKEIPPKDSLDMVAKMFEMAGLIVDEKL